MSKPLHYRGTYHVRAARLRAAAYAHPGTRCRRCGLTLAEITKRWEQEQAQRPTPTKPKRAPHWTAGHILDGDPQSPLAPECSRCNYSAGGRLRHQKRTPNTW